MFDRLLGQKIQNTQNIFGMVETKIFCHDTGNLFVINIQMTSVQLLWQ